LIQIKDIIKTRPYPVGISVVLVVEHLRRQDECRLELLVRPAVPPPQLKDRAGVELDGDLDDDDAARDQDGAQALGHGAGRVGVVGVEDHDVQPVHEQVHDELGVPLDVDPVVEEVVVVIKHALAKVLDLGEHLRQRDLARRELAPVRPDYAHHLIDLEADQRKERRGPAVGHAWLPGRTGELVFLAVVGEPGVIVLPPDGWFGPLGLAGPDVQEAQLVPDQAPDVCFQGVEIVRSAAVSV
jgi:hypothetical protein